MSQASEAVGRGAGHPNFWRLALGSVGVVFGDIGTSPLYAFREALRAAGRAQAGPDAVLGVLSLILWTLILIVTCKYVLILLYADNRGEGGTLALMALARNAFGPRGSGLLLLLGMGGLALFYGDALITPAISVLSAVEGLQVVSPATAGVVLPLTLVILGGLFAVQYRGTGAVARIAGPLTAFWFLTMALSGLRHIPDNLHVLGAFNPLLALGFLSGHGMIGLLVLGAVFLSVTGAEALYADLGHFGRRPIQVMWLCLVLPALMLNYLGQGALVLAHPEAARDPFFLLVPSWATLPLVLLATAATIIASQAVISGAFSLTRQAIQLGLLPRLEIVHTSKAHEGQIYLPRVNRWLFVGVVLLVLVFKSSTNLAGAYGIAVTATMVVDTLMAMAVVGWVWKWGLAGAVPLFLPFLVLELAFLGANSLKIVAGGWMPLCVAGVLMLVMLTWNKGLAALIAQIRREETPLKDLLRSLGRRTTQTVPGKAVFLTNDAVTAPTALMHNLKHNKVLHEQNVVLTFTTDQRPQVPSKERVRIERLNGQFVRVTAAFGFVETPRMRVVLAALRQEGLDLDMMESSFFLSRRTIRLAPDRHDSLPVWQRRLFAALARQADAARDYFRIPADRVVEIGTVVLF